MTHLMTPQKEKLICLRIVKDREAYDMRTALEELQDDYIADILQAYNIREANIPGVMLLVKEGLANYGIKSAYDVSIDRLQSMRWLGVVPARSLLDWRDYVENTACDSMPRSLPPEEEARIHARYEALRRKIAEEGI